MRIKHALAPAPTPEELALAPEQPVPAPEELAPAPEHNTERIRFYRVPSFKDTLAYVGHLTVTVTAAQQRAAWFMRLTELAGAQLRPCFHGYAVIVGGPPLAGFGPPEAVLDVIESVPAPPHCSAPTNASNGDSPATVETLRLLGEHPAGLSAGAVSRSRGCSPGSSYATLQRLLGEGRVRRNGALFMLA